MAFTYLVMMCRFCALGRVSTGRLTTSTGSHVGTGSDGNPPPPPEPRRKVSFTVAERSISRRRRTTAMLAVTAAILATAGCGVAAQSHRSGRPPVSSGSSRSTPDSAAGSDATAAAKAAAVARTLSNVDLVGQVLVPYTYGEQANQVSPAAAAANEWLGGAPTPAGLIAKYHLGGVILVNRASSDPTASTNATTNIASPTQLRSFTNGLQSAAGRLPAAAPLMIGTDQEYGTVNRIRSGIVQLPAAMAIGAAHNPAATQAAWAAAGQDLSSVGVNVDFAPDADVTRGPGNTVIGSRSFGSDAASDASQVAAAVRGLQSSGVAATLKHFPGHGDTDVNSHIALPVLRQSRTTLDDVDLAPFKAGIAAGTDLIMSGHLDVHAVDPGVPASFSSKVLTGLLRGQLGYRGVVISDALDMAPARAWAPGEAAVRAFLAGNDMLLMPPDLAKAQQGLLAAARSGRISHQRLVESVTRILTLKYAMPTEHAALATLDSAAQRAAAASVAAGSITILRGTCTGPLVQGAIRVSATPAWGQQRRWLTAALRTHGARVVSTGGSDVRLVGYGGTASAPPATVAATIAMDTPYVLGQATSPVRIATYSASETSMQALAAVLTGDAKATGRSPVAVPHLPRSACG